MSRSTKSDQYHRRWDGRSKECIGIALTLSQIGCSVAGELRARDTKATRVSTPPPRSRTDRIARAEAYLLGELVSKADVVGLQVHHAVGLGVGEDCERKARQCQYDKKRQAK